MKTLKEILELLGDANRIGNSNTWVAKNYSKKELIEDLTEINNGTKENISDDY